MHLTRREAIDILFDIVTRLRDDIDDASTWHSHPDRELPEEVPGEGPGGRSQEVGRRPADYDGLDIAEALEETFPAKEQGESPAPPNEAATRLALKAMQTGRSSRRRRRGKQRKR